MDGYTLLAYLAPGLTAAQLQMAALIESEFLAAGFSRTVAAAAIVNAQAESSLNPKAELKTAKEDSVGLFMLNSMGGLGAGMPVGTKYPGGDSRKDPQLNIGRIIGYIRNTRSVREALSAAGTDKEKMMQVWVYQIERPENKAAELVKRLALYRLMFPTGINGPPVNKEVVATDYAYIIERPQASSLETWVMRGLTAAAILLAGLGVLRTLR